MYLSSFVISVEFVNIYRLYIYTRVVLFCSQQSSAREIKKLSVGKEGEYFKIHKTCRCVLNHIFHLAK